MLPVSLLRPHPDNPNVGDEQALADSVDDNGFYGAITVRHHPDEEGAYQILGGEHRWRLACRRNQEELPAIVLTSVDDVQAVRIMIDDNEVGRLGHNDKDALDRCLDTLGDITGSRFDHVLAEAGRAKAEADEAAAAEKTRDLSWGGGDSDDPYSDETDSDSDFIQEYGILVMCESEVDQQLKYEDLAKTFGASSLRVVSV